MSFVKVLHLEMAISELSVKSCAFWKAMELRSLQPVVRASTDSSVSMNPLAVIFSNFKQDVAIVLKISGERDMQFDKSKVVSWGACMKNNCISGVSNDHAQQYNV